MLKKINQLLKLVGFNLVHAKKPKTHTIKGTTTGRYTAKQLLASKVTGVNCIPSPTCCVDDIGKTHYVGDDCTGGHQPTACEIKASQPASNNSITGPTS